MVLGNKTTIFYVKKLLNKEQSEGRLTIKQRKGQPLEDLWNGVSDEYWRSNKIWSKRSFTGSAIRSIAKNTILNMLR